MMNIKKIAGIGCGGFLLLILLLVVGGLFLDSEVELGTTAELDASPEVLFAYLASYDGLNRWWSAASDEIPDAPKMTVKHLDGPKTGEGMKVGFATGDTVFEEWTVKEIDAPHRVIYDIDFKIFVVERTISLQPSGDKTSVRWHETATISNPLMRYMTLMGSEGAVKNFDGALEVLGKVAGTTAE